MRPTATRSHATCWRGWQRRFKRSWTSRHCSRDLTFMTADGRSAWKRGSLVFAPRCGARNPPPDVGAVALVLLAESLAEHRLLIAEHEQEEGRPHDRSVREHRDAAEQEALTHDQRSDRDVHRVAHVPIEPGHDEALRRHHG